MGQTCVACCKEQPIESRRQGGSLAARRPKKPRTATFRNGDDIEGEAAVNLGVEGEEGGDKGQSTKKPKKLSEKEKHIQDAVNAFIDDIQSGLYRELPSHDWKFRKGFGTSNVALGAVEEAADQITAALNAQAKIAGRAEAAELMRAESTGDFGGGGNSFSMGNDGGRSGGEEGDQEMDDFSPVSAGGGRSATIPNTQYPRVLALHLQGQKLGDDGCCSIAKAVSYWSSSITHVNLRKNDLTDKGAVLFFDELKKSRCLKKLNIEENNLTSEGLVQVGTLISASPSLESINFSVANGCELDDAALTILADSIMMSDTLKTWRFSRVGSGGGSGVAEHSSGGGALSSHAARKASTAAGANSNQVSSSSGGGKKATGSSAGGDSSTMGGFTPSTLQNFFEKLIGHEEHVDQLQTLGLYECVSVPASGELIAMVAPVRSLCRWLKTMYCRLSVLDLRLPLGDKGAEVLAISLEHITCLESLNLNRCGIGSHGLTALADGMRKNSSIKKLDLSHQPGVLEHLKVDATSLCRLADCLSVNNTITELNIIELGMPKEAAEAFISALATNKSKSSLTQFGHNMIPDDTLAGNLATRIRENKKRMGLRVGQARKSVLGIEVSGPIRRSQPRSTFGDELETDDSDFTVEDDGSHGSSSAENSVSHRGGRGGSGGGRVVKASNPTASNTTTTTSGGGGDEYGADVPIASSASPGRSVTSRAPGQVQLRSGGGSSGSFRANSGSPTLKRGSSGRGGGFGSSNNRGGTTATRGGGGTGGRIPVGMKRNQDVHRSVDSAVNDDDIDVVI